MREGTSEIESSFGHIADVAEESKKRIAEMTAGVTDITAAISHLSDLSQQNSKNIFDLETEMSKFKT